MSQFHRNRTYMYKGIKLAVLKLIDLSSSRWYDPIDQIVTDHKSFLKVLSSFQWVELQCRDDFHVWLFEQWLCPCVRSLVLPGLGKLKVVVPCTSRNVCAHRVLLIIFHKGIGVKLVSRTPPCYQGGRKFSDIFVIHKV